MLNITNYKVYDLAESIIASGYPMSTKYCEEKVIDGVGVLQNFINEELVNGKSHSTWDATCKAQINRAKKLGKAKIGTGHDCFLKGIKVSFDITYPLYLSRQLQRYTWFDFVSSSSTMHKVHVTSLKESCNEYVDSEIINIVQKWIDRYNQFDPAKEKADGFSKYQIYMKIISNLPQGYELTARISTNYMQLKTMYNQRKNHKLKEDWGYFCNWCTSLPLFNELCLGLEINKEGTNK